jgi:hypothetical protein
MVTVCLLVALCMCLATAYNVLGGRKMFAIWAAMNGSHKMSQLTADARTVAAALNYLLEPEPDLVQDYPALTQNVIVNPATTLADVEFQSNVVNL